ncbi:MAG: rhodanese-like domain-containing protein [Pyrinomonadaceae bacterium]
MQHSEGFLKLVEDARSRIHEISVEEANARLIAHTDNTVRLIDVREDHEWTAGHAAGATHLGRGIIERDIEHFAPDKTAELILYCGGGYRSALAAYNLQRMGYTNVHSMTGGWTAWQAAELPVEGE